MARKNVLKSYKMIDSGDLSGSLTSNETNVINLDKASIVLAWTGTSPLGVIAVEARNGDNEPWYAVDMSATINISGNSGDHRLLFNELPFTDIRLQYTATSGTGTINATITAKQSGG